MTSKLAAAYFWDTKWWGDDYGIPRYNEYGQLVSYHKGQDIKCDTRETVYALDSGTVEEFWIDDELGGIVRVRPSYGGPNHFYCHQASLLVPIGAEIGPGDALSLVAGWDDDHGSAWSGPHTHFAMASSNVPWVNYIDPRPTILAVLAWANTPDNMVREGSLITWEQAQEIAAWLARPYNTYEYWYDLQTQGNWHGVYYGDIDGFPGPLTFDAEKWLYENAVNPAPLPTPVEPVEPEPEPEPNPDPTPAPKEPTVSDETKTEIGEIIKRDRESLRKHSLVKLGTKEFWNDALTRALNTFLQVGVTVIGAGAIGITEVDYLTALNLAAGGAMVSFIQSLIRATTPTETE